jgi:plastocyanin
MFRNSLAIAVVLAASAFAQNAKPASPSGPVMEMGALDFRPTGISIQSGQTVRFVNSSTSTHTVTDTPAPSKDKGSQRGDQLPAGEKAFDSGDIAPQQSWEHKFTTPGTYHFHCRYHDKDGMSGVVNVVK